MKQTTKFVAVILLTLLATACNKPEKQALTGTWQWTCTSGGIAGVNYTPESEGFEAEIVFKGGKFTFYKDGKKVTSGNYQIDGWETNEEDEMPHPDVLFRSTIRFPEAKCKEIAKATDGKIYLNPISLALLDIFTSYDGDYKELTLRDYSLVDDFRVTFVKKK
jgi:hypothetical protein